MDLSWTKKGKKEGLKNLDENWPETAPHIAKSSLQLSDIFQLALSVASSSRPSPEVFRFDYAEQVVKHQMRDRSLHIHLSGLTWNASARRQGLDISCFVAGTWSYIALQEADPWEVDRLESLGYNVIARTDIGLAVAMARDFLQGPGHLVQVMENNLESGILGFPGYFGLL